MLFRKYKLHNIKRSIKKYFFLVRWFLIGRYHCEGERLCYSILNKCVWFFILWCTIIYIRDLLEWIIWEVVYF